MTFELACKKAMEYFKKMYGDIGLSSIKDLGEKWLFDGEDVQHCAVYGKEGLTIDKNTGEIKPFIMMEDDNLQLYKKSADIDVPKEYRS